MVPLARLCMGRWIRFGVRERMDYIKVCICLKHRSDTYGGVWRAVSPQNQRSQISGGKDAVPGGHRHRSAWHRHPPPRQHHKLRLSTAAKAFCAPCWSRRAVTSVTLLLLYLWTQIAFDEAYGCMRATQGRTIGNSILFGDGSRASLFAGPPPVPLAARAPSANALAARGRCGCALVGLRFLYLWHFPAGGLSCSGEADDYSMRFRCRLLISLPVLCCRLFSRMPSSGQAVF